MRRRGGGGGGDGVIPKHMKTLLQVLKILTVITLTMLSVSQSLQSFRKTSMQCHEILKKPIKPQSSDGLALGSCCFL